MADLSWFPYDVALWDERVRELKLSFEAEGILMRLYRGAWVSAIPCTLQEDPDALARLLGAGWKKALPLMREHFTPTEGNEAQLRCEWLWKLYETQLAKHLSYQNRGQKGGKVKAELAKAASPATDSLAGKSTTEAFSCAPQLEHTAKSPAPEAAPGAEGAALPVAQTGNGERPRRAHTSAAALIREEEAAVRASLAPDRQVVERVDAPVPVKKLVELAGRRRIYDAAIGRAADRALDAMDPGEAHRLATECRLKCFPGTGQLSETKMATVRDALVAAVRVRMGWPNFEAWQGDESVFATQAEIFKRSPSAMAHA